MKKEIIEKTEIHLKNSINNGKFNIEDMLAKITGHVTPIKEEIQQGRFL